MNVASRFSHRYLYLKVIVLPVVMPKTALGEHCLWHSRLIESLHPIEKAAQSGAASRAFCKAHMVE